MRVIEYLRRRWWLVVVILALVACVGLLALARPAAAAPGDSPPAQNTVIVVVTIVYPTNPPTATPTPVFTPTPTLSAPGAAPGYSLMATNDFNAATPVVFGGGSGVMANNQIASLQLREYDFGCVINGGVETTGALSLCVHYIEIVGIYFLGVSVPMWPFTGAIVLLAIGFLIRA